MAYKNITRDVKFNCCKCGATESITKYFNKVEDYHNYQYNVNEGKEKLYCFKCRLEESEPDDTNDLVALGFPTLKGSEKQIMWAENIRRNKLANCDEELIKSIVSGDFYKSYDIENLRELRKDKKPRNISGKFDDSEKNINVSKIIYFLSVSSAEIIINNKDVLDWEEYSATIVSRFPNYKNKKHSCYTVLIPDDYIFTFENDAETETVVKIIKPAGEIINDTNPVDIKVNENSVTVLYTYDREFSRICRASGFEFDYDKNCYIYKQDQRGYNLDNVAANLIIELIRNNYAIRVNSLDAYNKAMNEEQIVIDTKWVYYNDKRQKFFIRTKYGDGTYDNAKKFKGIYYSRETKDIEADLCNYKDILAFADAYGFHISQKAINNIEKYKLEEEEKAIAVANGTTLKIQKKEQTITEKTEEEKEAETLEALTDD